MNWNAILLINMLAVCTGLNAQSRYPVSSIDSSLLRNSDAVVRCNDIALEISSTNSLVMEQHYVVTIFKESAIALACPALNYDRDSKITGLKGIIYDLNGMPVRQLKDDEVRDISAVKDEMLYSDDRMKIIQPVINGFPFTVEYRYRFSCKRILHYPDWRIVDAYRVSVEEAKLSITATKGLFPRIKELNLPAGVIITGDREENGTWEIRNLGAIEMEPLSPSLEEVTPVIYISPNEYSARGYKGNFSTWEGFGKWAYSLTEGRDSLPESIIGKVKDLVAEENDPIKRTRIVYSFFQETTRYVSVQLGIGSWQPVKSADVAEKGYGDCKGLVLYMKALLRAAGIQSWYTLVQAGEDALPVQTDFPGIQFNHVILCVEAGKDTIWLECSNPDQPFGYLGSFTSGKDVLLVTPDGGKLIHTPALKMSDNTLSRNILIVVDSSGNATVDLTARYRGVMYTFIESIVHLASQKQSDILNAIFGISGSNILSFKVTHDEELIPTGILTTKMFVRNYASVSGNRLLMPADKFIVQSEMLAKNDERRSDLCLRYPYIETDTLIIRYPSGFITESKPAGTEINNKFGQYEYLVNEKPDGISLIRQFTHFTGRYPASDYNEYVGFLRQVGKQDRTKIVLVPMQSSAK